MLFEMTGIWVRWVIKSLSEGTPRVLLTQTSTGEAPSSFFKKLEGTKLREPIHTLNWKQPQLFLKSRVNYVKCENL